MIISKVEWLNINLESEKTIFHYYPHNINKTHIKKVIFC
jgi:hypothetical protein